LTQDSGLISVADYRPTVIAGRYRVVDVLTQAETGDVVQGIDVREDRPVILKRIRRPDQNATTRLRTVHRVLSGLRHPSVMEVRGLSEGKADSWLVSDLAHGEELLEWWSRLPLGPEARFEERWPHVGPILHSLLEGLEAMHRAGMTHLDLKPSNIRVDHLGHAVIVDFGFGQPMDEVGLAGADESELNAWFGYLAPELVDGLFSSSQSDQWSLGAVIYLLLTGRRPLAGRTPDELQASYEKAKVPPLRDWRPEIPEDVEAIVLKMLSWEPEDRFETAGSVRRALGERLKQPPSQPYLPWSVPEVNLVGRDPFIAFFRRRLGELERSGEGALIRLAAPEGAGKSRLLRAWGEAVRGSSVQLFETSCRPGWPRTALEEWFHPPVCDIDLPPPKDIVEQALDALEGPAVLLLDGLEEVDAATWARVHRAAGAAATGERPVLLVLSGRELPDLAPRVSPSSPRFYNVELPPLTAAAVTDLLRPASDDPEDLQVRDGAAEAFCDEARGQPGRLVDVLLEDARTGRLVRDGNRWAVKMGGSLGDPVLPSRPALHEQFLAWVGELDGRVEIEILLTCLAMKRSAVLASIEHAAAQGELRFRHLDGRWWVQLAPGSVSKTVEVYSTPETHRRVARWLEANGDDCGLYAERTAIHHHKGTDYAAASAAYHEASAAEAIIGNTSDARRLEGIARTLAARAAGVRRGKIPT
jgi:hypothetical protein